MESTKPEPLTKEKIIEKFAKEYDEIKQRVEWLLKEIEKKRNKLKAKMSRQFELIKRKVENGNSLIAWSYASELLGDIDEYFVWELAENLIKKAFSGVIEE